MGPQTALLGSPTRTGPRLLPGQAGQVKSPALDMPGLALLEYPPAALRALHHGPGIPADPLLGAEPSGWGGTPPPQLCLRNHPLFQNKAFTQEHYK